MIKPIRGIAKLINKKQLSVKVTGVTFKITEPSDFKFYPGQFLTLIIGTGTARAYSICSDTNDLPNLSLAVETGHVGVGSDHIRNMRVGHKLSFIGPSGRVLLPENLPKHLYFFATGTGIAPFMSLFCKLVDLKFRGHINLFFGVRKETEMLFEQELNAFKKKLLHFDYKIYYSKPEDTHNLPGRITSAIPDLTDRKALYYICGHPHMVDEIIKSLQNSGIDGKNIIKEEFTHPRQTGKA